jgi:hypothetical protein
MARKSKRDELFDTLRARGLRKRAATMLSDAASAGRGGAGKGQKAALGMIADLRKAADELEERVTGGNKRKAAAQKAARTRARKARERSTAAKKAAATRKKKSSSSGSGGGRRKATTGAGRK